MDESISGIHLATSSGPSAPSAYKLLIVHTCEAQEWAMYLQDILRSSRKFQKRSILPYALDQAQELGARASDDFLGCKCILLLLTGALLDMLHEPALQDALHALLRPPHRVVVLLCGVSEVDVPPGAFEGWQSWRKVCAEDEPAVYVATILETIADSTQTEVQRLEEAPVAQEGHIPAASLTEDSDTDRSEEAASGEQKETVQMDEEEPRSRGNPSNAELCTTSQLTCLTVQPNRVLCGELETLFIIFTQKVDPQSLAEVEFSSAGAASKRVPGTVENEYTLSVAAPDMPAGAVSLTMYTGHSCVSLKPVTYYTIMGEVNRYLEKATDPLSFMCQAFNFTSDATEALDSMLTDSLKSKLPATSLRLFGVSQIEEDNMGAYQRSVELPTLLHFAAKYGLKKLTTILLQCPGALQAYSVMNRNGDYPNTLAEKSGFYDLRQLMDKFVETVDLPHCEDACAEDGGEVYEPMSTRDVGEGSGYCDSVYEPMLDLNPECAEELYEAMDAVQGNPDEAMLRIFFQAKPRGNSVHAIDEQPKSEVEEGDFLKDETEEEEEEDPYDIFPEDAYDVVDNACNPLICNRPPAPIPRTESQAEPEKHVTYISRVFSDKGTAYGKNTEMGYPAVRPAEDAPSPYYDPYAMMKTPGQRQLISLQERVKVGDISVDEAVDEFKAWKRDHEQRANSIRYQQENLKRLRESIARRREKPGRDLECEISAPLQRNLYWGSIATLPCAVYEATPAMETPPPSVPIQRGSWKTGSTSSMSSTESNRLSTHSALSFSSGTEPDIDDTSENVPLPPRPMRPANSPLLPPRVPPRIPERVPDKMLNERYISYPTRALPQRPSETPTSPAPPLPRRIR